MTKVTPVEKILHAQIQQIVELHNKQSENLYTICKLVTGICDHALYTQLGYISFREFCTEMLPFSQQTASKYVAIRRACIRLKYTDKEAAAILNAYPVRLLARALPLIKKKLGKRALAAYMESTHFRQRQINMWMSDKDINVLERELRLLGLEINSAGRRVNMSVSLVALAKDHARLRRLVKKHKTTT